MNTQNTAVTGARNAERKQDFEAASVESHRPIKAPRTGYPRECHKGAMVGEKATEQQIAVWRSVGLIK